MDHTVVPGYSYAVTASEDCTLTAANGWKLVLKAGIQQHFTAQFDTFTAPVPITLNVNFNSAPAGSAAAGGLSEEDLVTLGVLTAGEEPTEKASSPVGGPADGFSFVRAKGFRWGGQVQQPPAGCNGVAIVVGDGVEADFLLGCQMKLMCTDRASVTFTSEPLVSVQEVAAGRRCLFYFTEPIPSAEQYTVRILKNGVNELVPFSCSTSKAMYGYFNWLDAVDTGSGFYPELAWEVLEMETVYGPAVDKVPTEGSARPVSSGGVFEALSELTTTSAESSAVWLYLSSFPFGLGWGVSYTESGGVTGTMFDLIQEEGNNLTLVKFSAPVDAAFAHYWIDGGYTSPNMFNYTTVTMIPL